MNRAVFFQQNFLKRPLMTYNSRARTRQGMGLTVGLAILALLLPGCQQLDPEEGYTSRSLYRIDIETVCVNMFASQTMRRNIEFDLTAALDQQLEVHSPYKIVSDCRKADTSLNGTISNVAERVLTQQRELSRPLENEVVLLINVTWEDLRSGELILDNHPIKVRGDYAVLLGAGRDSATREATNEAALRIVEAMERPW